MRQRLKRDPFLAVFDAADPNVATERRSESTTSLQALWLMNNPEFHTQAEAFAERLLAGESDDPQRLRSAHLWVFGRPPDDEELKMGIQYVRGFANDRLAEGSSPQESRRHAWASYLRTIMSSNKFLYVE